MTFSHLTVICTVKFAQKQLNKCFFYVTTLSYCCLIYKCYEKTTHLGHMYILNLCAHTDKTERM